MTETRKNEVCFSPSESMDSVLKNEYLKGEISGIYTAQTLLEFFGEAIAQEIERRKTFDEEET